MAVLSPAVRRILCENPLTALVAPRSGPWSARMHALQRLDEVRYQRSKPGIKRRAARDQDVVKVAPGMIRQDAADGRLEAALDAVALDSPPDLLAHRKAEPRGVGRRQGRCRRLASLALQDECRRCPARAGAHALELGSALERGEPWWQPGIGPRAADRLRSGLRCGLDWGVGHAPRWPRLRPTGACAPWPGAVPEFVVPRRSPCACEIRGGACGPAGSVDRCASRLLSRVEALSCMRWGMPGIATSGSAAVVRCCRGRPPELQAAYMGQARASQSAAIVISGKPRKARPRRGRGAGAGLFGMAGARLR